MAETVDDDISSEDTQSEITVPSGITRFNRDYASSITSFNAPTNRSHRPKSSKPFRHATKPVQPGLRAGQEDPSSRPGDLITHLRDLIVYIEKPHAPEVLRAALKELKIAVRDVENRLQEIGGAGVRSPLGGSTLAADEYERSASDPTLSYTPLLDEYLDKVADFELAQERFNAFRLELREIEDRQQRFGPEGDHESGDDGVKSRENMEDARNMINDIQKAFSAVKAWELRCVQQNLLSSTRDTNEAVSVLIDMNGKREARSFLYPSNDWHIRWEAKKFETENKGAPDIPLPPSPEAAPEATPQVAPNLAPSRVHDPPSPPTRIGPSSSQKAMSESSLESQNGGTPSQQQRKIHSTFTQKLFLFLQNPRDDIYWTESANLAIVPSEQFLAALREYFSLTDVMEFVQILDLYGFHIVSEKFTPRTGPEIPLWEFKHSDQAFSPGNLPELKPAAQLPLKSDLHGVSKRFPRFPIPDSDITIHNALRRHHGPTALLWRTTIIYGITWEIPLFFAAHVAHGSSLGSLFTITGGNITAFATSCREYIAIFWKRPGLLLLDAVESMMSKSEQRVYELPSEPSSSPVSISISQDTDISQTAASMMSQESAIQQDKIYDSRAKIEVKATFNDHLDIASTIQWLCSAIRYSPDGLAVSTTVITEAPDTLTPQLNISTRPLAVNTDINLEETCWHKLFKQQVIASGFPIPRRSVGKGLEISYANMITLAQSIELVEIDGGLVAEGLTTLLIPTDRFDLADCNTIQWHLALKPLGVSTDEYNSLFPDSWYKEVDPNLLSSQRNFLGWVPSALVLPGTSKSNTSIETSHLPEIPKGKLLWTRGGGIGLNLKAITLNGTAAAVMSSISSGISTLDASNMNMALKNAAERRHAILYDEGAEVAWHLSLASLILYVAHIYLARQREPTTYRDAYPEPSANGGPAALQAIISSRSWQIPAEINALESPTEPEKFSDLIKRITFRIQKVEESLKETRTEAFKVGIKPPGSIIGVDLLDVAFFATYTRCKLKEVHQAWSHFTDLEPLVFFCRRLGAAIVPSSYEYPYPNPTHALCPAWTTVQEKFNYLVATGYTVSYLLKNNSFKDVSRLAEGIRWVCNPDEQIYSLHKYDEPSHCNHLQILESAKSVTKEEVEFKKRIPAFVENRKYAAFIFWEDRNKKIRKAFPVTVRKQKDQFSTPRNYAPLLSSSRPAANQDNKTASSLNPTLSQIPKSSLTEVHRNVENSEGEKRIPRMSARSTNSTFAGTSAVSSHTPREATLYAARSSISPSGKDLAEVSNISSHSASTHTTLIGSLSNPTRGTNNSSHTSMPTSLGRSPTSVHSDMQNNGKLSPPLLRREGRKISSIQDLNSLDESSSTQKPAPPVKSPIAPLASSSSTPPRTADHSSRRHSQRQGSGPGDIHRRSSNREAGARRSRSRSESRNERPRERGMQDTRGRDGEYSTHRRRRRSTSAVRIENRQKDSGKQDSLKRSR